MNGKPSSNIARDGRGVAALEFAIVLPVLLALLGCLADFGLAFWYKGLLAASVAQGAQYAFLARMNLSTAAVQGIVGRKLSLPPDAVVVTAPACGCASGMPATVSGTACGATCPNGATAGAYVTITARYAYTPIMPLYSWLAGTTLVESTTMRLR